MSSNIKLKSGLCMYSTGWWLNRTETTQPQVNLAPR